MFDLRDPSDAVPPFAHGTNLGRFCGVIEDIGPAVTSTQSLSRPVPSFRSFTKAGFLIHKTMPIPFFVVVRIPREHRVRRFTVRNLYADPCV